MDNPNVTAGINLFNAAVDTVKEWKPLDKFSSLKYVDIGKFFGNFAQPAPNFPAVLDRIKKNSHTYLCNYLCIFAIMQLIGLIFRPGAVLLLVFASHLVLWGYILYTMKVHEYNFKDAYPTIGLVTLVLFILTLYHKSHMSSLIYLEFLPTLMCLGHMIMAVPTVEVTPDDKKTN